jgi:hypothetical protein
MGDHRTLDEFLGSDNGESHDGKADNGESHDGKAGDEGTDASTDDALELTPTYQWTPEGAACADCGAVVERRWREDDVYVCADCKDW